MVQTSRVPVPLGPLSLWYGERLMKDGWIKLYRKSIDSQVFKNDHLWKLWCLCLLKANHKTQYVYIDGVVEPIKVDPGQFITGRFQLHGDYHQWGRGYKKRFPSAYTAWRWLLTLQRMQNLSIKSFSKYSIISIINWDLYQENEQQLSNRRATAEHKQERITMKKNTLSVKKTDPDVKSFILEWGEIWSQKFGKPYTANWGKEVKLVKGMLKIHSLQELRELRDDFFTSKDPFIIQSDYSIGVFKTMVNKLITNRKLDPVEQAREEMRNDPVKQ